MSEGHVVLLGDSIFDNAANTRERRLTAVDLRLVCCEPADYANPIEPSGRGGLKIAPAAAIFALSEPT